MPHIIAPSVDSASSVSKDFDPPIEGRLRAILARDSSLTPDQLEAVPRVLRIGRPGRHGIPAIMGWNTGPFIVSPQARTILDELEPGRHRYAPLSVRTEQEYKGTADHGTYHLIVAPPALDAVVIEETGFHRGMGRQGFKASGGWISMSPDAPCVLRSDVIEGHHFWRLSERFHFLYVCSDALWQRIKAAGLRGWSAERKCQVKSA